MVARAPLPLVYWLASDEAQGKGTAAVMNWFLPPLSPSKNMVEVYHHSLWSPVRQWNLSRCSQLLHSQSSGTFKVYGRNSTCLTLGEGLKPFSLEKLGALEGSAWRKEAGVTSEQCHSGRGHTGWFMPPYTYWVSQWRKWCHLVPQGSVHLRSNLYEPRKHWVFFNQILAKVKKSKSAWDQLSGFVPLKDLCLNKSRWCRREHFFLHFLLEAQPEALKLSLPAFPSPGKQINPRLDAGDRKQPHTATHPGVAWHFFGVLWKGAIVWLPFVSNASSLPSPKALQCALAATWLTLDKVALQKLTFQLSTKRTLQRSLERSGG